jgi:hypothetical protein
MNTQGMVYFRSHSRFSRFNPLSAAGGGQASFGIFPQFGGSTGIKALKSLMCDLHHGGMGGNMRG